MIYLVNALKPPYKVILIILYGIIWYLKGHVDSYMKILRNLYKTDTSIRRTLWLVPRGVRLKRFYCNPNLQATLGKNSGEEKLDLKLDLFKSYLSVQHRFVVLSDVHPVYQTESVVSACSIDDSNCRIITRFTTVTRLPECSPKCW